MGGWVGVGGWVGAESGAGGWVGCDVMAPNSPTPPTSHMRGPGLKKRLFFTACGTAPAPSHAFIQRQGLEILVDPVLMLFQCFFNFYRLAVVLALMCAEVLCLADVPVFCTP